MKRVVLVLLIIVPAVLAGVYFFPRTESGVSQVNYATLKASGELQNGWLPQDLPASVSHFEQAFDQATGNGRATFQYSVSDTATLDSKCTLLSSDDNGRRYGCEAANAFIQVQLHNDGTGTLISNPKPPVSTEKSGKNPL